MGAEERRRGPARCGTGSRAASNLTDAQVDEIERRLVEHIEDLAAQARNLRELRRRLCPPAGAVDAVRRMFDDHLEANRVGFSSAARALQTVGEQGFGRCTQCGSPIGFAALERAPAAERCTTCAQQRLHRPPDDQSQPDLPEGRP